MLFVQGQNGNHLIHSTNEDQCKAIINVVIYSESKMTHEVKLHTARYCTEQQYQQHGRVRSITHAVTAINVLAVCPEPTRHPSSIHSSTQDKCTNIIDVAVYSKSKMKYGSGKITYGPILYQTPITASSNKVNCTRSNKYKRTSCSSRANTPPVPFI